MDGCESWTVKKAEHWRIDVLELWCWRTLESPLDSKESKPVNPKGNRPWIFIARTCWSWSSNTLATWCKELSYWKRPCCWERLRAGGEGDNRGWDGWTASPTLCRWVCVVFGSWWWTGKLVCWCPWGHKESDTTEQLNWPELTLTSHTLLRDKKRVRSLQQTWDFAESFRNYLHLIFLSWVLRPSIWSLSINILIINFWSN